MHAREFANIMMLNASIKARAHDMFLRLSGARKALSRHLLFYCASE